MGSADGARRSRLAEVFTHRGVAEAYRHRPPYPSEVFTILEKLIVDERRDVLDVGAGEGALARPLAARMDRVDAVEVSAAMVAAGRERPGGRRDNLRWVVAALERCRLRGPYALVTAGASLHWMAWDPVLRRVAAAMTERASLVVVEHGPRDLPWSDQLVKVIQRHSRRPDFDPRHSLVDALCEAGHFDLVGRTETAPVLFRQPIESYVEHFHSTASLARELMPEDEAVAFDSAVEQVVRPWSADGMLDLPIVANLAWGRPRTAPNGLKSPAVPG